MTIMAAVSARPIRVQPNRAVAWVGRISLVMNQNAMAETTPETMTPLYSAFMILPPSETLTKKVPTMEAMMDAAPSASG